jgi:hypothetical protein
MFEGWRRLYIGDFSDPSTTAERKQIIPDYPTIEDFYKSRRLSGIVAPPKRLFCALPRNWRAADHPFIRER